MSRILRWILVGTMLLALLPAIPAKADVAQPNLTCTPFQNPSGGRDVYLICAPAQPNGDLVVFAHGYMDPRLPVGTIPTDQLFLPDGTSLPGLVTSLGYTFAMTTYRKNGLAVVEGVEDTAALITFIKTNFPIKRVYIIGASEGGLVTTLLTEKYPNLVKGGLATCGPIGDFPKQVNYWGDFRVVFDYFFPNVVPPTAAYIAPETMTAWSTYQAGSLTPVPGVLQGAVLQALQAARPRTIAQLLSVTGAPIDPFDPTNSTGATVLGLLGYNILATDDGREELFGGAFNPATNEGLPFDNNSPYRYYRGSLNDALLNQRTARFDGDNSAIAKISTPGLYQTTGRLTIPLITLHTTGDPIVPYWHETLYTKKLGWPGALMRTNIPILRYGHCNFTAGEALFGFWLLVFRSSGQQIPPAAVNAVLTQPSAQADFQKLMKQYGPVSSANPAP